MKFWKYTFTFLLLTFAAVVIAVFQLPDSNLHIIACDVGQGDAILITYGSTQILTDGGPDRKVLDCLGEYMPFWDREIELVILTHPDSDHVTGLVSVAQNYEIDKLLINPVDPGTQVYEALKNAVGGRGIDVINPTTGTKLGTGLIYLDIVSPEQDLFLKLDQNIGKDGLSDYSISEEANSYSIAYLLSFRNFSALFTGDIPPETSDDIANSWEYGSVNYIKIPHHGSVNGLTQGLLEKVKPNVAVISVGKNSWGLPKDEVLEMISKYGTEILRTDQRGDIEFITDGERYWLN